MLEVIHLTKYFIHGLLTKNITYAVRDVSFQVAPGKTLGIMGASGSGKSTLARLIAGLLPPTAGQVVYQGSSLTRLTASQRKLFCRKLQMIFQHPGLALDPRQTIGSALLEPLYVHKLIHSRRQGLDKLDKLLHITQLSPDVLAKYPWQISGGQAQRIVIARALGLEPEVIIADEPTAMLDNSVQAQILALLKTVQQQTGLSLILISHDPDIIKSCADHMVSMANGKIVIAGLPSEILPRSGGLFSLRQAMLST
ncbi:ABC transporter ATP-binding protein [Sporomusa acidovorans]|uniref:Oligopeptide transport ATP-binding protein OppF n=1 Tax=Sporomusa acidovorans (strain ATCC 49682 / DSM 3132 / Mol) TaxID=1123286 RepID=A0ABZ3IY05_SPOA4|nr:dipeptide/oligopeptide/nickel ABC transporter ATP-binding protein [Sporomusa acidovorans]OZC22188.1 oligopeptide transport ATP-binding protein OppF [Sporomusa acidovorans DSM 3132]SDE81926.1 oligopeptide transport system ATP-binding protein [Sporomusa acidovorans]